MAESDLIERLRPGDHVCWAFATDAVRDRVCAAYVRGAVVADHRAMLFTYATTPAQSLAALAAEGIDVDTLVRDGQLDVLSLDVLSAQDAYLGDDGGHFDAVAMIESCLQACAEARAAGFAGLRLLGDMGWATGPVAGVERLGWYEAQVDRVYAEGFAIGLCLYDQRLFGAPQLASVRAAHPGSADPSTDPDWAPLLRARVMRDQIGVHLDGETDLSNRGSLLALLEGLADAAKGASPPTVDVSSLRFADVATAHSLLVVAARLGGLSIVGASAHLTRLLTLLGAQRIPGLIINPTEELREPA